MTKKQKALEIYRRLLKANPDPKIELAYSTPFELLVATILSAQATDKTVNTVTPQLFSKYRTIEVYAKAPLSELVELVKRINFHTNKAKNIKAAATMIMREYNGKVPDSMDKLTALPGVARKTANVILSTVFHKAEGIVIDTHGIRLSNKLGLTSHTDPVKIEKDLMGLLPKNTWINFGRLLTLHGRYQCPARPHTCTGCPLGDLCPEYTRV